MLTQESETKERINEFRTHPASSRKSAFPYPTIDGIRKMKRIGNYINDGENSGYFAKISDKKPILQS